MDRQKESTPGQGRPPAVTSSIMRRIPAKNTQPERSVRSLVYHLGYRFRLHRRDLPGTPDLVFPSRRKVIFVHGCFWHGHSCLPRRRLPHSHVAFWKGKIRENRARDRRVLERLESLGWASLVLWECELSDPSEIARKVTVFLENPSQQTSRLT
jgi:DNA mismatch endonuclease (patch repair protein)